MKACAYCGRQNEDSQDRCSGCLTELPTPAPEVVPGVTGPKLPALFDLTQVPGGLTFEEGFSRPHWDVIGAFIAANAEPDLIQQVWDGAVLDWVARLARELGGDYRMRTSENVVLLSAQPETEAERVLSFSERAIQKIEDYLGEAARRRRPGWCVILLFAEEDDYYQYLSAFYPAGSHPATGGVHLDGGYDHIALHDHVGRNLQTIAHELAHHFLFAFDIPHWLHEAVAMSIEGLVGGNCRALLPGDEAIRHHDFWSETNIQSFWAGTSFRVPGESFHLSYGLALVLVQLLAEKPRADFLAFIQTADWHDGGQAAAWDCLGICLGDLAGTFLGPGNWRPQRKLIKDCWDKARADEEAAAQVEDTVDLPGEAWPAEPSDPPPSIAPVERKRACSYCGRENDDSVVRCTGCGTELPVTTVS